MNDLKAYLEDSKRLERPPWCPQNLYSLMLWCWQLLYQSRPTFTQIKQELNNFEEHQQQSKNDSFQDESNQECKGPNQQGQADSN